MVDPRDGVQALRDLNAYIREATARTRAGAAPDELASAIRFRAAWDRHRTLDQVQHAAARKPANAGPLNSHMLVLRSLDLMRQLSTDYLRRFLVQVETLQWLESAREQLGRDTGKDGKAAKPGRRARRKG